MPWQETLLMDQRVQFIADYQRDVFDVAELARRYGISRKTAYNGSTATTWEAPSGWSIGRGAPRCPHATPPRSSRRCWMGAATIRHGAPRSS